MSDSPITVGLVGYGYWGAKHARVFAGLRDVDLVIIEQDDARRAAAKETVAVHTAASLSEVGHRLDAVVIATPPHSHLELCEEAFSMGLHVLVEKPMAMNGQDARTIIAAALQADRTLMVGHTFEYHEGVRKLRELIAAGETGTVMAIDSARLGPGPYRVDVDVLWDLAPHDVSISNMILGSQPARVRAMGRDLRHRGHLDVVHFELEYDDPQVIMYGNLSLLNPDKVRRVTVIADECVCVLNDLSQDQLRIYQSAEGDSEIPEGEMPIRFRFGDVHSPHIPMSEPLGVQARHFIDVIQSGESPLTDGIAGCRVVDVIEAIEVSLASGNTETVGGVTPVAALESVG